MLQPGWCCSRQGHVIKSGIFQDTWTTVTALGSSWKDERISTAADPGLDYQWLSGSWESHSTWRFLSDWLIVTSLADRHLWWVCADPPVHRNGISPTDIGPPAHGNGFSPTETGPVTPEIGCSPPYPHTHICVVSTMERIRNSTSHPNTKTKPFLPSIAESPQPKFSVSRSLLRWPQIATAERSSQKIKNSTITRNIKSNECLSHHTSTTAPAELISLQTRRLCWLQVNFIGASEWWCQRNKPKMKPCLNGSTV